MNRFPIAICLTGMLAMPAWAAAEKFTIDQDTAIVYFEIKRLGFSNAIGHFSGASGKVSLDLQARRGSVDFVIPTKTIDMGSAAWTAHLSDEGLFNVKKFPIMHFKSENLVFEGEKVVAADGQFTMLGVTRPLRVSVTDFQCSTSPYNKKQICSGNIFARLKRSEFGLTKYIPEVSDEVSIRVPVDAYLD